MTDSSELVEQLRAALGDGYEIERELMGSGMSRVFVAHERALDRQVVVKVLPPELAAGVNRERFQREIQLAAQLQHPHIVPLHTAGVHGDLLYFTMPFIEGESLRHAIATGVRFSPRDVVRILHDVADALAHAHARGVIHRDIKPGNVLRSGSHAMVTDFGVAKAISASLPVSGMTTSGMVIGTPAYMAPEQLAGDPAADHRVDIYAVGLLAYELLAGEAPFKASSPQETMAAQLTRVPEPITRKRPDAPPALASLVARCLAKNPADRPQTAAELVGILDDLEITSGASPPLRSRATVGGWMAAGAVAVGLAVAAFHFSRQDPTPAAAPAADSSTVVPPAATLTREDSLAIARAVQKKLSEQQAAVQARAESAQRRDDSATVLESVGADPATATLAMRRILDSLRVEIQSAVLDSVARQRGLRDAQAIVRQFGGADAEGARRFFSQGREGASGDRTTRVGIVVPEAPSITPSREAFATRRADLGPPRRVLIAYPNPERLAGPLIAAADSLVDSLHHALGHSARYVLVPADSVREILGTSRALSAITRLANVELIISLAATPPVGDVFNWTVTVRDLGAHPAYTTRVINMSERLDSPLRRADTLVAQTVAHLQQLDYSPRRPPSPPPPPE